MVDETTRGAAEKVFAALGHETRRDLLVLLSTLGDELPSGYLAARFHHSWPTITRHLGVLEAAGLVEVRREGRSAFYRLRRERLIRIVEGWLRHVSPTSPTKTWAPTGPRSTDDLRALDPSHASLARRAKKTTKKRKEP